MEVDKSVIQCLLEAIGMFLNAHTAFLLSTAAMVVHNIKWVSI